MYTCHWQIIGLVRIEGQGMRVRIETEKERRENAKCASVLCRIGKWTGVAAVVSLVFAGITGAIFGSETPLPAFFMVSFMGLVFVMVWLGIGACFLSD